MSRLNESRIYQPKWNSFQNSNQVLKNANIKKGRRIEDSSYVSEDYQ